jgi:flagellar basal body-associated protein FliL
MARMHHVVPSKLVLIVLAIVVFSVGIGARVAWESSPVAEAQAGLEQYGTV